MKRLLSWLVDGQNPDGDQTMKRLILGAAFVVAATSASLAQGAYTAPGYGDYYGYAPGYSGYAPGYSYYGAPGYGYGPGYGYRGWSENDTERGGPGPRVGAGSGMGIGAVR
jgi:hypothetical protein